MAWGCFTTNLAMPGFGSLFAGRVVGYFQIPFTIVGFGLTLIFGIQTILWFTSNWNRLQQIQDEPDAYYAQVWEHFRWPLLGMAIFGFALVWALMTSSSIMAQARRDEALAPHPKPPKIK